ncbi:MAG: UDP-N-acetylmuramoyl-L-alanyl-D-glutamate--2,6-diaminopimelate ligase [Candidatus Eisenbacteria bacterium]|nr:UDP-N-acetylmuramoyl-L-alanyl-D-glutamate--2,6-diaminopimelate ligase [Candidatus Eisenbacteria bacterium]
MTRQISLESLIRVLPQKKHIGALGKTITGISIDSRAVQPGDVFVCMRGAHADGHLFAADADKKGALAIVCEEEMQGLAGTLVIVPDTRLALPLLSSTFFGEPSKELSVVGITGTNGKTTTSHIVASIFEENGFRTGIIGTVGYKYAGNEKTALHTTPESVEFQRTLREILDSGGRAAVAEISSHGLYLGRTLETEFDVCVFTNLTRDHLDFHGSFEEYADAKLRLFKREFTKFKEGAKGLVNKDDPYGTFFLEQSSIPVFTFGTKDGSWVKAKNIELGEKGIRFKAEFQQGIETVCSPLVGMFNVYNCLAAFGTGLLLGFSPGSIKNGIEKAEGVKGRMDRVEKGQEFAVVIDYAHTPDALEGLLKTSREIWKGKIICVFGCGGDRDRGKREIMGRLASAHADYSVITSDNPRTEDPSAIMSEIEKGFAGSKAKFEKIEDRKAAIERAIKMARKGDVVLIAGKGHEDYQIVGTERRRFDDREAAAEILKELGFEKKGSGKRN